MNQMCAVHLQFNCPICYPNLATLVPFPQIPAVYLPGVPVKKKNTPIQTGTGKQKQKKQTAAKLPVLPTINGGTPIPLQANNALPKKVKASTTLLPKPRPRPKIKPARKKPTYKYRNPNQPPQPLGPLPSYNYPRGYGIYGVGVPPIYNGKRKAKTPVTTLSPKILKDEMIIDDEVACQVLQQLGLQQQFFKSGKVLAWALQPDDEAFLNIHDYVARGQTDGFGCKILSILRIIAKAETLAEKTLDFKDDPSVQGKLRMMLWHGTKKHCVASILENGLKLPLPHLGGQLFGAGIYFADSIAKSSAYCDYEPTGEKESYLLLCDVLLGNMSKSNRPTHGYKSDTGWSSNLNSNTAGQFDSVKGCGQWSPDNEWNMEIDGCTWPLGPLVRNKADSGSLTLTYNEYIVYNSEQVQPKYLVKVQFTHAPVHEDV